MKLLRKRGRRGIYVGGYAGGLVPHEVRFQAAFPWVLNSIQFGNSTFLQRKPLASRTISGRQHSYARPKLAPTIKSKR